MLTGVHDCHDGRWAFTRGGVYTRIQSREYSYDEISETINSTALAAKPGEVYLPQVPRQADYTTGQIGKLEWGFATTDARLRRHGWDYHFGYYDHVRCHGFYPSFLWENGTQVDFPDNLHLFCGRNPGGDESEEHREFRRMRLGRGTYSQDVFNEKLVQFIRGNTGARRGVGRAAPDSRRKAGGRDARGGARPFFLYHPSQLPHGPVAVPEIHPKIANVEGLTEYEKEYASMVLRLDDTVGLILDELEAAGVLDNTIFIFAADNGHEVYALEQGRTSRTHNIHTGEAFDNITTRFTTGTGGDVFNGNDGLAGLKFSNWEGGVRIPLIVRWPERVAAGSVTDALVAAYDLMPTLAELLGVPMPDDKDGASFLPALAGRSEDVPPHEPILCSSWVGPSLLSADGYKLRRIESTESFQLYYLPDDPQEEEDLVDAKPEIVRKLAEIMLRECGGNYQNGNPKAHLLGYEDPRFGMLSPMAGRGLLYTP
jgi:arylsulfatase A-like enzyme